MLRRLSLALSALLMWLFFAPNFVSSLSILLDHSLGPPIC